MNKKCLGCGAILQNVNPDLEGYTVNIDKDICERCFRIKNYGDYKRVEKDNTNFINILKKINKTNSLVLLVVDIVTISDKLKEITKYLDNDILLVLTKRDVLPLSLKDEKLINYVDNIKLNVKDTVILSSNKNYNMDILYDKFNKYKKDNNVYVVGYTNAGKSTMINKLIYNYSDLSIDITTSILPSTTLDMIEIKLNDELTLIDTPGILDSGNIFNYLGVKDLKKIIPNKEIKPITYQVKGKQYIYIDDIVKIDVVDNNITLFFSNRLKVNRFYKDKETALKENIINISDGEDIVISGLGFIKVMKSGKFKVYTLNNVEVYTRKNLI